MPTNLHELSCSDKDGVRRVIAVRIGVALTAWLACLGLATKSPAATYSVQERVDVLSAREIAISPDGSIWAATQSSMIFRLSRTGKPSGIRLASKRYPLATNTGIAFGPDGHIWAGASGVPRENGSGVFRIEPSGRRKAFSLNAFEQERVSFAPGPDGNVWFVGLKGAVGRITPAGRVRYFKVKDGEYLTAITQGSDGAMWAAGADTIVRITPAGRSSHQLVPRLGINDITLGPDGKIWVSGRCGAYRITRPKNVTNFPNKFRFRSQTGQSLEQCRSLYSIAPGPSGDIVFSAGYFDEDSDEFEGDVSFGSLSVGDSPTETMIDDRPDMAFRGGMKTGADGRVWLTNEYLGLLALEPDQPIVQKPASPTIRSIAVGPRSLQAQLRCSGNPGKLCAGTVTVKSGRSTLLKRRYAIAPFNRLYVRTRVPQEFRGHRATVTMLSKDSLSGRVKRISRVVKLR